MSTWKQKFDPFSGKEKEWYRWSRKFLSYASMKDYIEILEDETIVIPKYSTDLKSNETKKQKARDNNNQAYHDLLHACGQEDVSFSCVESAKTEDLPHGSAPLAWANLIQRFEPDTGASQVEMKREFASSKPKKNQDPVEWVVEMERLQKQLKLVHSHDIDEESMMIQIIDGLPREYEDIIVLFERQLKLKNNKLTVQEMKSELRSKFRRLNKWEREKQSDGDKRKNNDRSRNCDVGKNDSDKASSTKNPTKDKKAGRSTGNDVGLTTQTGKSVTTKCETCGRPGHGKNTCWKDENNKNQRPDWYKLCDYCNKVEHDNTDCYKKQKDQVKTPMYDRG